MRVALRWRIAGTMTLGLLALPLVGGIPSRLAARPPLAMTAWAVPWPSTPSRTAMREAAYWWAHAVQLADDETDEARAARHTWDAAASFDADKERRHFLASDDEGYLKRALAAAQKAERLAQSPEERARAEQRRRQWEAVARPS
jgi:hypothetical protein